MLSEHTVALTTVYLKIRPLPATSFPAHVTRHRGVTLIYADPSATMVEFAFWATATLTDEEGDMYRVALGQPRRGEGPVSEEIMAGMVQPRESMLLPADRDMVIDLEALLALPSARSSAGG